MKALLESSQILVKAIHHLASSPAHSLPPSVTLELKWQVFHSKQSVLLLLCHDLCQAIWVGTGDLGIRVFSKPTEGCIQPSEGYCAQFL